MILLKLLGTLFNWALYGIVAVQVYIYHLSFPKDNIKIKCLVYFVLAFETVQTIMNGVDVFNGFARGFGDMTIIGNPGISPIYTPVMGSIIAFVVQLFFCYRIFVIRRSAWWLCVLIALTALIQLVGGVAGGIRAQIFVNDISQGHSHGQTILVYLWLVGDAVTDVVIASAMSFFLLHRRGRRPSQQIDIVARIVRLTIETNVLSATIAVISLILFAGIPDQAYYICPTMFLGKIYSNTILLTFNNRAIIKQKLTSHVASTMNNYPTWRSDVQTTGPFSAGLNPEYEDIETSTNYTTMSPDVTSVTGSLPPLSPLRRGQSGGYPAEKADGRIKMRGMSSAPGWTSPPPMSTLLPDTGPSYSPRSAESSSFNALTPTSPTTYNALSQESRITDSSGLTPLVPLRAASSWRTTSEDVPAPPKGPRYR
ncbi:hypothetical protein CPB85DRAFT_192505 [Mucidula mucida]|nr:hypothetical protein CPB85DRAFT_192505 [Mucidula mucida]